MFNRLKDFYLTMRSKSAISLTLALSADSISINPEKAKRLRIGLFQRKELKFILPLVSDHTIHD